MRTSIRWTVVVAALAGCLEYHAPNTQDIDEHDCGACHLRHYQLTSAPVHPGRFPTTCDDCHVTRGWVPALEGLHPDGAFPIRSGAHVSSRCLECHRLGQGPSQDGANTVCIVCHTEPASAPPHAGIPEYVFDPAAPHFCLSCHPAGTAGHPEDRFPIASGAHEMPCTDCHRRELGPDGAGNTSCTGCHTGEHARGRTDDQHDEANGYQWSDSNPHFCLECHPDGRN